MKEIVAVIRMEMMSKTKKALSDIEIPYLNAKACLGRGKGLVDLDLLKGAEKGVEEAVMQLGQGRLISKRIINIVLPDKKVSKAVKAIMAVNRTGEPGDGKIFVLPVEDSITVRTGESAETSLDGE